MKHRVARLVAVGTALAAMTVMFASGASAFDDPYSGGNMMGPGYTGPAYADPGQIGPGMMNPTYTGPGTMDPSYAGPAFMDPANMDPENMPGPVYSGEHHFQLGFASMAEQMPHIVGQPLEDEQYGANGDSLQQTTAGLMVWRNADNWTAFTDGSHTWVNGPYGIQMRPNHELFNWEAR